MNIKDQRTLNKRNLKKIYRDIWECKTISLDNSILCGFSLAEYRKLYGLDSTERVTIKLKSAIGTLFVPAEGSAVCVDFSWGKFESEDPVCGTAFDESHFENGIVDFSYIIADSDLSFDDCKFNDTTVKFIGCKFGCQDLSFYGADLGESSFYFHVSEFKKGDLVFAYSKNLSGRVQIANCLFDQRNFEFYDMDNPSADFILADFDLSNCRICFTNSAVESILCYRVTFSARTDFDIATAKFITIQDSIIGNAVLIGNSGYQNITRICLLGTRNLGQIQILNQFSKELFASQKKLFYPYPFFDSPKSKDLSAKRRPSSEDLRRFYESQLDLDLQLCDTSYDEKAQQMNMLKENAASVGDYALEDQFYLLGRKYQNLSKIDGNLIQFQQLKNSYKAGDPHYYPLAWFGILFRAILGAISYLLEGLFLDLLCGNYATNPLKFLFAVMSLVVGFAGGYYYFEQIVGLFDLSQTTVLSTNPLFLSLYFSFFQFFQIDCGITLMIPTIHVLSLIEKVLGMIILAVFTVSYTRKVIK